MPTLFAGPFQPSAAKMCSGSRMVSSVIVYPIARAQGRQICATASEKIHWEFGSPGNSDRGGFARCSRDHIDPATWKDLTIWQARVCKLVLFH